MKEFSKSWVSSKKPNKQRKYRYNAPLHARGAFLNAHLSKELRTKYGFRALRLRVGDKVKIMRGQFKNQEGKVEEVNVKDLKVYVAKMEHVKRDGSKARYPLQASNLLLVELNTDDKKRMAGLQKDSESKTQSTTAKKTSDKPKAKVSTEAKKKKSESKKE